MTSQPYRDHDIHRDILGELDWDQTVNSTEVGVQVSGGIVTLTGSVSNRIKQLSAERAAHRVEGVRAVVNKVTVQPASSMAPNDADIAAQISRGLFGICHEAVDRLAITVSDGTVVLDGRAATSALRFQAGQIAREAAGVGGVLNRITVAEWNDDALQIQSSIEKAFLELARQSLRHISIEVDGDVVTLRGRVDSWVQHDDAVRAARVPGIRHVRSMLVVATQTPIDVPIFIAG